MVPFLLTTKLCSHFLPSWPVMLSIMASLKGWGNLDDSIMIKLMEKIAGLDKEA